MRNLIFSPLAILCFFASLIIIMPPILILALIKAGLPLTPIQNLCFISVRALASSFVSFNLAILNCLKLTQWRIQGAEHLSKTESLLVLSNHQSWVDIPALLAAIHGRTPFFTFFLKRELIWVPFLGLAWWALDYPFMHRYSREQLQKNPHLKGKDLAITRKACAKLKNHPVTLVNYVEGTRFTTTKHQKQQSPYINLLKPKSGGVAFTLHAMQDKISHFIDLTVVYPTSQPPTFWQLLSGQITEVIIDIQKYPLPTYLALGDYAEDPEFRAQFQAWLNQVWQAKDARISKIKANLLKP